MSELKHPLKHFKLKSKATADEGNSAKELAKESFCTHITDCFADNQNYFILNDSIRGTKYKSFKILEKEELLLQLSEIIADLVVLDKDSRNKYI